MSDPHDIYADIRGKYAPYNYPPDVLICESTGEPLLPDAETPGMAWAVLAGLLIVPAVFGLSLLIEALT